MTGDTTEPIPESSHEGFPLEAEPPSPLRLLFQFFVVPLGIVGACVAVFLLFGAVTVEKRDPEQLLSDVQSSADSTRRWQAAFQLSKSIDALTDPARRKQMAERVASVFGRAKADDEESRKIRRYLALVLGKLRSDVATEVLIAALDDNDPETRLYSLWAIGMIADHSAAPRVAAFAASDDPALRKMSAYVLGQIGDRGAIPSLVALLEDARADVRWNSAIALARFDDRRALPVLREMIDRDALAKDPATRADQIESTISGAIPEVARLGDRDSIPALEKLSKGDASLLVRDAARKALATLSVVGSR